MKKEGSVSSLSSDEIEEIYLTYSVIYSKGLAHYSYDYSHKELHQQDYRIIEYNYWSYMLKWLSNPEYYHIDKYLNNSNENFVRSSEYAQYKCKLAGKNYQYNLLDIDYYKIGYISINAGEVSIREAAH
ncbi:hypothetical protein C1645_834336 [Glomus cerebriforme]|uniref:Uncharacterized protein n=1 Tax=Glomus cerebriforme TaxID=658196 RepID=A0A397SDY6_9GLOM|nr:hypothetical protein C1645_834336 [Glomus cerebriforme]